MKRGEVRWYTFARPDKKRPVLILTRDSVLEYLGEVTIAPITSTIRDIPSEVFLSKTGGMPRDCAVNCDHLQTVSKRKIGALISSLHPAKMVEVGRAIHFALDIESKSGQPLRGVGRGKPLRSRKDVAVLVFLANPFGNNVPSFHILFIRSHVMEKYSISSTIAQAGYFVDDVTGAVVPPIHPSTTFARDDNYELIGAYNYSRYQNPTYDQVERLATKLDNGVEAMLFSSGMAAITAVFETLDMGQHIVAPVIMYHGAQDWLRYIAKKRNIGLTLFDATASGALRRSIIPGKTAMVWIETPVNPTWDVIDIADAVQAAHDAGATLGVDCTVSTPITTRAIDLGADIVFHSGSKYFNGHSDVTAGILVTRESDDRWGQIKFIRKHVGGVLGPFESWLLLRGMRTLSIRFERASQNAQRIAEHFEHHPKVEDVFYPGLKSHPGHEIARRQMTNGFGGMLSLCVKGGASQAKALATKLKLFVSATSLGGVESLVEHRASVEGPMSQVQPNLLRFSVGIEDVEDLIADIEQGLEEI